MLSGFAMSKEEIMRYKLLILCLLCLSFRLVSASPSAMVMNHNKIRKRVFHLDTPHLISKYSCQGWIKLDNYGKLISCDTAEPVQLEKSVIPKNSRLIFYPNQSIHLVLLSKNTRLQGLLCAGYGVEGPAQELYPDGKLRTIYLAQDAVIQQYPCKSGSFSTVVFHPDGRLAACELASAVKVGNLRYPARSRLKFNAQGKIIKHSKPLFYKRWAMDIIDVIA
jgi:hypothetical protein